MLTRQMPCSQCGTLVDIQIGQPQIVNGLHCSVIIIEHSAQTTCPGCLSKVRPIVSGISGFAIQMPVIKEQEQAPMVIMPGSNERN